MMALSKISIHSKSFQYYSLKSLGRDDIIKKLPFSIKILLENLLRFSKGQSHIVEQINKLLNFYDPTYKTFEIAFQPARILMQDFTGVPAVVDLAAMRDACVTQGKNPDQVNPLIPVDLVIDHSVMVDYAGGKDSFAQNVALEYERNKERYQFLKWGQQAFKNFRVVPPGMGICHQVNLEYLAQTVFVNEETNTIYPDSLVGTDSHTTMVNGLSVLGWGVGGIEAEACMLGQPLSMLVPEVVGVRLSGNVPEGITATDIVLTIVNILRTKGVVGQFVEFFGNGLSKLSLADRATIANMAPEYGATCGFFPIDDETLKYLRLTGRTEHHVDLVEAYAKEQFLWRDELSEPTFKDVVDLDLSTLKPTISGPKRPQDKIDLDHAKESALNLNADKTTYPVEGSDWTLQNHDVVLAAITSCTNTSNPSVMIAAGLVAKKACELGLVTKPWVKTSLAPGSKVALDYLTKAGLLPYLEKLGFNVVGFGCTTCIGNSGPLSKNISQVIEDNNLIVSGVLSGNRNFEGRIHPLIKSNYLASPPLVVAYALAGSLLVDLTKDAIATVDGKAVYLKDIWPTQKEIDDCVNASIKTDFFKKRYDTIFDGDENWQNIKIPKSKTYAWDDKSTYVKCPPYFDNKMGDSAKPIMGAKIIGLFGDSITTDHISPAGNIKASAPAGVYLIDHNIDPKDFNSYGSRRGHHEVMMRGTFANIRIQNEMTPGKTGGYTIDPTTQKESKLYDAAMNAKNKNIPLIVIAGKEYGTGSSRDWAAKGTKLLGIKAVLAESFERIHRSNLLGMGVLPLVFLKGETRKTLDLKGDEKIDIQDLNEKLKPGSILKICITYKDGHQKEIEVLCRIDTNDEMDYFKSGGILNYMLDKF